MIICNFIYVTFILKCYGLYYLHTPNLRLAVYYAALYKTSIILARNNFVETEKVNEIERTA